MARSKDSEAELALLPNHVSMYGDTLSRVALTVNSSLDLKGILHRLASLTLEVIPADHCTMLLLDESGEQLQPVVSLGQRTDAELWQEIKKVAPTDLRLDRKRWKALRVERALGIPDVFSSPLIPNRIASLLKGRSLVMFPLTGAGEPLGLLVLDWLEPGKDFPEEELAFVEAIGAYASLAVRNARLYENLETKARWLERLVRIGAILNSSNSLRSVLDLICAAFEELLGTSHCSVNLLDESSPSGVRPLAVRGISWFTRHPENISCVSQEEIQRVSAIWKTSPQPIVYSDSQAQTVVNPLNIPSSIRSAALFPLVRPSALLGFVVAGFPHADGLDQADLETGQALADQAATAIWRATLHENLHLRVQKLEVLYRLSDVVAGTADLPAVLSRLNDVLKPELGVGIDSIAVANAELRQSVGAAAPNAQQLEAIRSWRSVASRGGQLHPRKTQSGLLAPMVHHDRIQGVVQFVFDESSVDGSDDDLFNAVASGCAEVIYKSELRKNLEASERRVAISAERERIARDLHDSVGQILTGMGMRLASYVDESPDEEWAGRFEELTNLAARGSREIRQAIYALLFLQVRGSGLVQSLKDLSRKFKATTGIFVTFKVQGDPFPLLATQEDALFRVAHEGLMNVERHSRASAVSIVLTYSGEGVSLDVRDDGIGLANRQVFGQEGSHFGLRGLQQLTNECGGTLKIRNASPRGVELQARIPRKSNESASSSRH